MNSIELVAIGRELERADVLALFTRRMAGCATIAERNPAEAERATIMQRQLSVLIDEIRTGMHLGEAALSDELQKGD